MSFSFSFDLDDSELDSDLAFQTSSSLNLDQQNDDNTDDLPLIPHAEVSLKDLIDSVPPMVSYTPVIIPLSSTSSSEKNTLLFRRDLFDARFQVLHHSDSDSGDEEEEDTVTDGVKKEKKDKQKEEEVFIDQSSDLIKGIYEGGLKTWECSLDLVDCLVEREERLANENESVYVGTGTVELGCGTALPSCRVFYNLLQELKVSPQEEGPKELPPKTRIHLQDYNKEVLTLITLPNLLLAYALHLLSSDSTPLTNQPGELEVTTEFLESFEKTLKDYNIELKFFEGDWKSMGEKLEEREKEKYELVLTSETVYEIASLPSLLSLLKTISYPSTAPSKKTDCLVACKRIYFGVGGGEHEFKRQTEEDFDGKITTIWGDVGRGEGKNKGVGRVVFKVDW